MTDVFLFQGEASPTDVKLRDPTRVAVDNPVDGSTTATTLVSGSILVKRVTDGASTTNTAPIATDAVKRTVAGSTASSTTPSAVDAIKRTVVASATATATPAATDAIKRTVAGAATANATPVATDATKRTVDGSATGSAAPVAVDAIKRTVAGSVIATVTPSATDAVKRTVDGASTGSAIPSGQDAVKRIVDGAATGIATPTATDAVRRVIDGALTTSADPIAVDAVGRVVDGATIASAMPSAAAQLKLTIDGQSLASTTPSASDTIKRVQDGSSAGTAVPVSSSAANKALVGATGQSVSLTNVDSIDRAMNGASTADATASATFDEPESLDVDGFTTASASVEGSITPSIGASGGVLEWLEGDFQGLKIVAPAGALPIPTSLAPVARGGFTGYRSIGPNVQFDHIDFDLPVSLTIPVVVPDTHSLRHVRIIKTDANGFTRARKPTSVDEDAQTVTLEVDSFSGFGGVLAAHDHIFVCNTNKVLKASNPHFFQKCDCACWLAAVFVVAYPNSGGMDGGGNFSCACSIRSSAPNGTSFNLPIHHLIYGDNVTPPERNAFTTNFEIGLEVGHDTDGVWEPAGTFVENGVTFYAYINAYKARNADNLFLLPMNHRCDPPLYSPPLFAEGFIAGTEEITTCRTERANPGPIKWRYLAALVDAALGPFSYDGGHCIDPGESDAPEDDVNYFTPGWHNAIPEGGAGQEMWQSFCHSLEGGLVEGKWEGSFHALTDPSGGTCLLAASYPPTQGTISTHYVFPKAVFTFPLSSISVDDSFDLNVTFVNPFTGLPIDGTHVYDDFNEDDIDAVPALGIDDLGPGDSMFQGTSIVRNGYADYTIFGAKIRARKGHRTFNVFADHEFGSFLFIPKYPIDSVQFTLTCGVPAFVDFPTPSLSYQIGAPMVDGLNPVMCRILDYLGQFELFNVVDGATNVVDLAMSSGGGNGITTGILNGTLSQAAVDGIASFPDLTAYALGRHYTVTLTSTGLGQSHNFNWYTISPEFWIGLRFQTPPTIHAGVNFDIKVDLVDASGAIVTPDTVDSVAISGAGSFTGFGSAVPSGGTATFNGNFPAAGTYTVQVVTSGTHYDGPPVTVTMDFVVLP